MEEPVAIFSGQFKLGRQWEHGLVEVSEHGFDCGRILVAVVDVVVETDELSVRGEDITYSSSQRMAKKKDKKAKVFIPTWDSFLCRLTGRPHGTRLSSPS